MKHTNIMEEQGIQRFDWFEMSKAIAEYWIDISGNDGMIRLRDMAKEKTSEFREMCDLLVRIISHVPEAKSSK
jgi:hypothetical protein